ncbi:MAG: hypothetical protein ACPGSM_19250 [Thiolinea sp.]
MTMMPQTKGLTELLNKVLPDNISKSTAILWLKNPTETAGTQQILDVLSTIPGIHNTQVARARPVMLKVDYCLKQTSVANMVRESARQGLVIRQVGC